MLGLSFSRRLLHPRYLLSWLALGCLFVVAYLPWRWRRYLGFRLGALMYAHNKKRRHIVSTQLKCYYAQSTEPEPTQAEHEQKTKQALGEYLAAVLDYSVLFFRSRAYSLSRTDIHGLEHLEQAILNNQPVILLLGHSVWLEFAPLALGQHFPCYGSYKPFSNPVFDWMIARSRLKDVEFVIARDEGMIKLVRALRPGRLLFFLPDEDHGEKASVFAPFLGIDKATLTTPARIAKLTQATSFPVMVFFEAERGRYQIHIGKALANFGQQAALEDASLMNQAFETLITQQPLQYMWVLKLFRTRPTGSKQIY